MFAFRMDGDAELRLLEERHAEELFALVDRNRAYLRQWLPWLDGTKAPPDSRAFIQSTLDQFAKNAGFIAGIWYQGGLAGVVGFHGIDWANRRTSLGYWCSAERQGLGLVTRSCRALVAHAFREWKLNRVEIACATENTRSRAIPTRLGFTAEGTSRDAEWLYDHFVDHVQYAMLARDWEG
jgi:ribosomal-protein-serine acetyltransferase